MSSAVGIKCRNALTEVPDTEAGGGGAFFVKPGDCQFLMSMNSDVLKNCSVYCDWNALCDAWTAKLSSIQYTYIEDRLKKLYH